MHVYINFEFKKTVSGFFGEFSGTKDYWNIPDFTEVENCISDVFKLLKNENQTVITFCTYENTEKEYYRVFKQFDGKVSCVFWKRNSYGQVVETDFSENLPLSKKEVKQHVLAALELIKADSKEEA